MKVAVVGGGIAGLAAAWSLRNDAAVTVFEPGELGGKLQTPPFAGGAVDSGPDAFLTRVPAAVELCHELGLDDLVAPAAGRSQLWWHGALRALPEGLVLGAPTRWKPLWRSGLCSPWETVRAALDEVLPRRRFDGDVTVADLISSRYGNAVSERLVDPLVGGIHAGRTDSLSAEATAPQLLAAARRSRSLARGLRSVPPRADGAAPASAAGGAGAGAAAAGAGAGAAPAGAGAGAAPAGSAANAGGRAAPAPVFLTPRHGTGELAARLVAALQDSDVTFRRERVDRLRPVGTQVGLDPVDDIFDAAVLAVPSWAAAPMLGDAAPGGPIETAAAGLAAIEWASVTLVTLAYDAGDLTVPPGVNGFLVPRPEGRLMTACSFGSSKWPHWAEPGQVILRVSAGRHLDDRADVLDDEPLVQRLAGEVNEALGANGQPTAWRVSRWPRSFPQYRVGHLDRVAGIERQLAASLPQVALTGASYRGSGIPACITSGRQAAEALLTRVAAASRG